MVKSVLTCDRKMYEMNDLQYYLWLNGKKMNAAMPMDLLNSDAYQNQIMFENLACQRCD